MTGSLPGDRTKKDGANAAAGTIAGYAETDEGGSIFFGIAPDAQFAIFKVLPDDGSGAPESTTMNALDNFYA